MKLRILSAAMLVLALALTPLAAGAGTILTPRTQLINFAQVCVQDTPGGPCSSTSYDLSRNPGQSGIGSLIHNLSVPWRLATGEYFSTQNYTADDTLDSSYLLIGGSTIRGQVAVGGDGITASALASMEVTIKGTRVDQDFTNPFSLTATVTKDVATSAPFESAIYDFELDVPEDFDAVEITGLSADVSFESLGYDGYVDGRGESYFMFPYYMVEETE